jgi:hypothetical protein
MRAPDAAQRVTLAERHEECRTASGTHYGAALSVVKNPVKSSVT